MRPFARFATVMALIWLWPVTMLRAQPDPMVEMAAEALKFTLDVTGEKWLEMVAAQPDDPDEQAFADWLAARPDIAGAVVHGNAIEARSSDGIMLRFSDEQPGVHGQMGPAPTWGLPSLAVAGELRCIGEVVPGTKALIIDTDGAIINDPNREIQRMLEHANYTVVEHGGGVKHFLEMADAAITIVDSHGSTDSGGKHYVLAGGYQESTKVSSLVEYYHWLKSGELAAARAVRRDKQTGQPLKVVTYIDIWDTWFERNLPALPNNAAIFFYTCHSRDLDESPWPIFKAKGASFYFGFMGVVADPWGIEWIKRYLDLLTGANIHDPWDRDPPRRAMSFENAFKYIIKRPQYLADPVYGAMPNYDIFWEDTWFSVAPHIDVAQIAPVPDEPPKYEVNIYGGTGRADESRVYCGGEPAEFSSIAGGDGGVFRVVLPIDRTGPLVINDKWGRQSNMIMISRFSGEVEFDYDGPEAAGKVTLKCDALTSGTRLHRPLDPELMFCGVPEEAKELEYVLVGPDVDWELSWDFNSTKRIGLATITARGRGTAKGRGGTDDDDKPDGSMSVALTPAYDDADMLDCQATVWAGCTIGPIAVTYHSPAGVQTEQRMITCAGIPATCRYSIPDARLPEVAGTMAGFGNWKLKPVALTPNPHDLEAPAWTPPGLRDGGMLTLLTALHSPPWRG